MQSLFDPVLIYKRFLFSPSFWFNALIILIISIWIQKKFLSHHPLKSFFIPFLILKLVCCFVLSYLIFRPGGGTFTIGDTAPFFSIGQLYYSVFRDSLSEYFLQLWSNYPSHPNILHFGEELYAWMLIQPKVLFFSKIVSLFSIITFGNVFATSFYFAFISFLGTWKLLGALFRLFPDAKFIILISFFLSPGLLIFSSIILKESIVCAGFFYCIGTWLDYKFNKRNPGRIEWIVFLVAIFFVLKLKPLYLLLLIPSALAFQIFFPTFIHSDSFSLKSFVKQISVYLVFLILFFMLAFSMIRIGDQTLLGYVYSEYSIGINDSAGTLHLGFNNFQPTLSSFIKHIPFALGAVLFRPFLWECFNVTHYIAGIENFLVLVVSCFSLCIMITHFIYLKKHIFELQARKEILISVLLLLFIISGAVMMGFTTPNFGTLYRYRIIFYPFYVFIILRVTGKYFKGIC